jgi:hypothetical protein
MEIFAIIFAFFIISEIATVFLTFTGMDRDSAKFQSISALTGTGFTTHESESVVETRQRRRIISTLMIVGQTGIILLVAGLFRRHEEHIFSLTTVSYLLALYLFYRLLSNKRVSFWVRRWIEKGFTMTGTLRKRQLEELLHLDDGYGLIAIHIPAKSSYIGQKINETDLRKKEILILNVEREGKVFSLPAADWIIQKGDTLTCYGKAKNF